MDDRPAGIRARISRAIGLLTLFIAGHAIAAFPEYCVQSQVDLNTRIAALQGSPATLDVVGGTFQFPSNPIPPNTNFIFAPYSVIRGGYGPNCVTRSLSVDVGATVLTGISAQIEIFGNLTFDHLTLQSPYFELRNKEIADPVPSPVVLFSHIKFTGTQGSFGPINVNWEQDSSIGGEVRIVDSLFINNTVTNAFLEDDCIITLHVFEGAPNFHLVNNTVYKNGGDANGICFWNHLDGASGEGVLFAHDNIFYGNAGADFYADNPNLELIDNTIGVANYPVAGNTSVSGTSTLDPQIDANYRPIEPGSRSINSGESNGDFAATDLAGNARIVGTRIDRGAFESSVDNGFLLSVTNVQDGDNPPPVGSLRAAITNANSNGGGEISFHIGTDCSPRKVITLTKGLPAITAPISILGYKQPGAQKNTRDDGGGDDAVICIVLEGSNTVVNGLVAANTANAVLDVQGLAFGGFTGSAIRLNGGSHHNIAGNHIGGAVGAVTLAPSNYGIYVAAGVSNAFIGGQDPVNRNIIGAAMTDGIYVAGPGSSTPAASGISILGNYVGVEYNVGLTMPYLNSGNAVKGLHVLGSNNAISGNVVGFNGNDGIDLDGTAATANTIEYNYIGTSEGSTTALPNGSMGVRVENGAHDNKIRTNWIEDNSGTAVRIVSGLGNTIRYNFIYGNGSYGIDLGAGGVTQNDDDSAFGALLLANRGLNFPDLTLATGVPANYGVVEGTLQSTAGDYFIDVYASPACDASGYGEGARFVGNKKVTIAPIAGQIATVAFSVSVSANPGEWITATATDAPTNDFPGNSSEFSQCMKYTNDVIFADSFE